MTLKDFLDKVNISDYIVTAERDGILSNIKKCVLYKSIFYIDLYDYKFANLLYSQEIQLTAEGILVKDEEGDEIQLRFYRRELVNVRELCEGIG